MYTQLTNFPDSVTSPALSADGRLLTFIRGPSSFVGAGQIWVKSLPDGEPRQLTRDDLEKMSPVFSWDGARIAYTTINKQGGWSTQEVPIHGGDPKMLLQNAAGLVWTDKNRVLFSEIIRGGGTHMKIVAAEESRAGARDVYVPMPKGAMAHRSFPSPDGQWLLVAEMDDRGTWLPCRLVPADGSWTGTPVGPSGAACWFAAWSPDAKWIYVNSAVGGGFRIWRQRFDGSGVVGEPEQITETATDEEGIAVAPDGRSLITAVGLKQGSVWLHGPKGEEQISREGIAHDPTFTPDWKGVLYLLAKGGSHESCELWIAHLDSGRNEPVAPGFFVSGHEFRPAFAVSPDGRRVVLAARDREGKSRLWVAPLDRSSPPRRLIAGEGDGPVFGPRNDIYFRAREADYGVAYRIQEDGTGLQKVLHHGVYSTLRVSPNAEHLIVYAYANGDHGGHAGAHEGGATLALPLSGGRPVPIYKRFAHLKWSPTGRYLFVSLRKSFYSGQMGKTYVIPLPPGRVLPDIPAGGFSSDESIARMPGVRLIESPDVTPGPTADSFTFSRVTVQRNLYRIRMP